MALFGHSSYKDPTKAAQPYLDKAESATRAGYDPYIQRGQQAGDVLGGQYDSMVNDPAAFVNHLMESYKPSSQYQYKSNQLSNELSNTARAGGVAGTPRHQQQQAELLDSLMGNDIQQWYNNLMGVYDQGLKGYQGWDTQGYDASTGEAGDLSNIYGSQATLAYKGAEQHNSKHNDLMQGLMRLFGTGAGALVGGIPGAAIGGSLFGQPKYSR